MDFLGDILGSIIIVLIIIFAIYKDELLCTISNYDIATYELCTELEDCIVTIELINDYVVAISTKEKTCNVVK